MPDQSQPALPEPVGPPNATPTGADVRPGHLDGKAAAAALAKVGSRAERRQLRRRIRAARRHARLVYRRGALLPRTLWGAVAFTAAVSMVCGATTAVVYARFEHRVDVMEADLHSRIERQAPQVIADVIAAEERTDAGVSDAIIRTNNAFGELTSYAGALVAVENGRSYWLTALDAVKPATVTPPAPIQVLVAGGEAPAVVWSWDDRTGIALLAADLGTDSVRALTPRAWAGPGATAAGARLSAARLGVEDRAPALLEVTAGDPRGRSFTLSGTPGAVPLGAAIIDPNGGLAGVVTGVGDPHLVTPVRAACQRVLTCAGM